MRKLTEVSAQIEKAFNKVSATLAVLDAVIRGFFGDRYIMHMTLDNTRIGNAHKERLGTHLFNGRATSIAHAGT
jgi:hypothetical protein